MIWTFHFVGPSEPFQYLLVHPFSISVENQAVVPPTYGFCAWPRDRIVDCCCIRLRYTITEAPYDASIQQTSKLAFSRIAMELSVMWVVNRLFCLYDEASVFRLK